MATSATYGTSNPYIQYNITVTENSQNIEANKTNVTVQVRYWRTNSYQTWGSGTVYCRIDGAVYYDSVSSSQIIDSNGITLFSRTLDIAHNADGTKSLAVSAWIDHSAPLTSDEQGFSPTLTTIPRATMPSFGNATMGSNLAISLPRASSSFTHALRYAFGSMSGEIASNVATSYSWSVPITLANQIPSATVGVGRIYCDTYSGGALIGTQSQQLIAYVPDNIVPTVPNITATEATAGLAAKFGAYVQSKSALTIGVTSDSQYGATISRCVVTVDGITYNTYSFTSNIITGSGNLTISATVTDTRGRTATGTLPITVLPYTAPTITAMSAWRINTAGTAADDGERIAVQAAYTIASVDGKNNRTYKLSYKRYTATSYTTFDSGTAATAYSNTQLYTSSPVISQDYVHVIRLEISDFFTTISYEVSLPTADTVYDILSSGNGIAFGKVAEVEGLMDVDYDVRLRKKIAVGAEVDPEGAALQTISLSLAGNPVNDYVVEASSNEYWAWRKWASGIAECWRERACGGVNCSVSWGSVYESANTWGPDLYPFNFVSKPSQFLRTSQSTSSSYFVEDGYNTASNTGSWYFWRPGYTSAGSTVIVSVYVIGRWK